MHPLPPPISRYRLLEWSDATFSVEWLLGQKWVMVFEADTKAECRSWIIQRRIVVEDLT